MSENMNTPSDSRVGEIQAWLPDEVWTAMPSLTDDGVIMHRVYDDEGHCIAECSNPNLAEFIAPAPTDVAYLLAQLRARDEALAKVEALHQAAYKAVEPWATGYRFTGEHCAFDGENWPCMTVKAAGLHP